MAETCTSSSLLKGDRCTKESEAAPSCASEASAVCALPKISCSISLSDWASPTLHSVHASLSSKAHKISDQDPCSETAPVACLKTVPLTRYTSPPHITTNVFALQSSVSDNVPDQQMINTGLVNSSPSVFVRNNSFLASRDGQVLKFASPGTETSLGDSNSQPRTLDADTVLKQSFLISPSNEQANISILKMPVELLNLNLISPAPKIVDSDRWIPDCCSPSSRYCFRVCTPDNKITESGWTRYLDQSADFSTRGGSQEFSLPDSKILSQATRCRKRTAQRRGYGSCKKAMMELEDSSMASDASSGPEQPFFGEDADQELSEDSAFAHERRYLMEPSALKDDACSSKLNYETTSAALPAKDFIGGKRTKRHGSEEVCLPVLNHMHHTKEVALVATVDFSPPEGSDDNLNLSHQLTTSENLDDVQLVDDRLDILQKLIPNSEKLDREDMLAVAIDYVKSLELKIRMFESSKMDVADSHASMAGEDFRRPVPTSLPTINGLENIIADQGTVLKDRGLCLMPVHLLGEAL